MLISLIAVFFLSPPTHLKHFDSSERRDAKSEGIPVDGVQFVENPGLPCSSLSCLVLLLMHDSPP